MENVIDIKKASFAYARQTVWQDLTFSIFKGELLCLLGANGCGKTTLLNCLHGDQRLQKGHILLNGQQIDAMPTTEIARKIGVVFQEHTTPFPYSVLDVVLMGRGPHLGMFESPSEKDNEIAINSLKNMGVFDLKDKRYTEISGGERQLVLIARTLTQEPEIILLDEPTSFLDFKNQALVLEMIRKLTRQGLTVIMTSHFPNHALICADRVALMNQGTMVGVGKTKEIMTESNLEKTYGIGVKILSVDDDKKGEKIRFCMPCIREHSIGEAV
jgi:iron complex transport system ATP-binding protein